MDRDRRKEIWAWYLYDFANSSFSTIIVTVAYSIYFTQVVAQDQNAEAWWGWGYGLSMLAIGLVSPVLGALADFSGTKKQYLIIFTVLSVLATALLVLVERGDVWLGIGLFAVANIGFNGGLTFYNAYLKELSSADNIGHISGSGFAVGYIGGLVSLLLVFPLIQGGFVPENLIYYRLSFPVTAVFFLVFSIPAFLYLKDKRKEQRVIRRFSYWSLGFRRVMTTFKEVRRFRELRKYFIAYLIYIDGINTIIVFAGIFAASVLGFSPQELVVFFIVMQLSSMAGAYAFGIVTDRLGARRTIILTLLIWMGIILWAFYIQSKPEFYALGLVAGVALGSNQSASRTLLGQFAPKKKITEFFGFFSLTGKLAATVGPPLYGVIASSAGQRWAILSIGAFFLVGLGLLLTVNEKSGIETAKAMDLEFP